MSHIKRLVTLFSVSTLIAALFTLASIPDVSYALASPAGGRPTQAPSTRTNGITNVLSNYESVIRESAPGPDGLRHIDIPATISALQKEHINTYAYLIVRQPDWSDFPGFVQAAQKAEINVWPYLVPPTECCSQPYGENYVAWAEAIAKLSLQYHNLTAWVIDDVQFNLTTFTPSYMKQIHDAAHAINPDLPFYPILYSDRYNSTFVGSYAPYIDGAIFPYEGDDYHDLNNLDPFITQLDTAVNVMQQFGKRLYLMPYVTKLSSSPFPPSSSTIDTMVKTGLAYMNSGKLDGIVLFVEPLVSAIEKCPTTSYADTLQLRLPWNSQTPGGDYVQASQKVTVDPNASAYSISFNQQDSFITYPLDLGYYEKELLVDGVVVWRMDAASDGSYTWAPQTVDLTAALQGKSSATVTFRMANPKGVTNAMVGGLIGINFSVANVTADGMTIANGNFSTDSGWTFYSTSPPFNAAYHHSSYQCDAEREQHISTVVQLGFGPNSLVYRSLSATGITEGQKNTLVSTAQKALHEDRDGNKEAAAKLTDVLAHQATAMRLSILAQQATMVANELRSANG